MVASAKMVYGDKVDSNRDTTNDKRDDIAPAKKVPMITHYESREALDVLFRGACRW